MRLIHVADLHLDSPFSGLGRQAGQLQKHLIEAPYHAFERCVSIAINQKVDLFIIAGDIYDAERQTIYALNFFMKQLERLSHHNIPTVLIHGNHDYLDLDKVPVKYPDHVHVFRSDQVESQLIQLNEEESVAIHAFSYTRRWTSQDKLNEYPPADSEATYNIGILHGAIASGQVDKDNYAPFVVQDMVNKGYDYWALGHIHQQEVLHHQPLIQYAGTIQGRNRKEIGDKGAQLVEIDSLHHQVKSQFISLAAIVWQDAHISCESDWQAPDIVKAVQLITDNYIDQAQASQQSHIITIYLDDFQKLDPSLQDQVESGELMVSLEHELATIPFVLINQIKVRRHLLKEPFEYDQMLKISFASALDGLRTGDAYANVMTDVFKHPQVKQHLSDLTRDFELKQDIIEAAQALVEEYIGHDLRLEVNPIED